MSIAQMTLAWRADGMSSTQKLVLLSLADNANDQGECYPSVAQIAQRACLAERAVRNAIRALEAGGYLRTIARSGTSSTYFLSIEAGSTPAPDADPPRHVVPPRGAPDAAPAPDAPRHQMPPTPAPDADPPRHVVPPTPARGAPKPSLNRQMNRHLTVNKPRDARADVPRPEDVPADVWRDWLAIRKAKRAPLTVTAMRGVEREAAKAGLTLVEALRVCCERSWQAFRADWLAGNQKPARGPPAYVSELDRIADAIHAGRRAPDPNVIDMEAHDVGA